MKPLKPSLLVTAAFSIALVVVAVFNSQPITAQQTPPGREVKVINTSAEAVPVSVGNFPTFPSFPSSISHARQNWEYTVVIAPLVQNNAPATAAAVQAKLNELGWQGWELVAGEGAVGGGFLILKRPRA